MQDIMRHLLSYIGKDKHADSLVDKLCARFEATQDLQQWRNLAFCIAQVCPKCALQLSKGIQSHTLYTSLAAQFWY